MQIVKVPQNSEEWFEARRGKITGSSSSGIGLKSQPLKEEIVALFDQHEMDYETTGTGKCKETISQLMERATPLMKYELFRDGKKKRGIYQVIADRVFRAKNEEEEYEDPRDRGHRLEDDAIDKLEKKLKKKFIRDIGLIISDKNKHLSVSPDAVAEYKKDKIIEAAEAKNFEDAHHVEAVIENKVPSELWPQVLHYFIVIDTLQKLHLVFNTDRTVHESMAFHVITIERKNIEHLIEEKQQELEFALMYVQEILDEYTF